ncbi:MAG: hypothetical protein L3J57_09840 [Desulfuromusa sp.]|nr:hypothetical protein [Desulfuromusa sp.]
MYLKMEYLSIQDISAQKEAEEKAIKRGHGESASGNRSRKQPHSLIEE